MYNIKFGDRFWYEHGGQTGSYTPAQLQELRKTSLAKIICENSDGIDYIQKNVFRGESKYNPMVSCKSLPDVDFSQWREEPRGGHSGIFNSFEMKFLIFVHTKFN